MGTATLESASRGMKLHVKDIVLVVDTSATNDPAPQTAQERISFVRDAISEANMRLQHAGTGIRINAFVEDNDIRVESK